jgi:hypothetical protein
MMRVNSLIVKCKIKVSRRSGVAGRRVPDKREMRHCDRLLTDKIYTDENLLGT